MFSFLRIPLFDNLFLLILWNFVWCEGEGWPQYSESGMCKCWSFFRILCFIIFCQKTPPPSGWEFFLSNSLDFVLVWRGRLATMFRAGGANAGQPWRDHSVINAQSSLPPTNFNYFIYNLQLHYLLPARSLSSCIIVQLLTESWTPVRPLGHQRS